MKNLLVLIFLAVFSAGIRGQELDSLLNIMDNEAPEKAEKQDDPASNPVIVDDNGDEVNITVGEKEVLKVMEKGDSTLVIVGEKPVVEVTGQPDSTSIRIGDKEIIIVENEGDTDIHVGDADHKDKHLLSSSRFRGHWAGFEWGINNFLDADYTLSREGDDSFMDLNTGRSWIINLNCAQYSLGFGTSHAGSVIGLGLEFNNYFFDGNNSMAEVNDHVVGVDTTGIVKSKLTSTFLRIPLLLEVQFPNTNRGKRVFISAGVIGGLKLGSHTKVVYENENGKSKVKNRDDFNISPFRLGATARIGFGCISIFGDYYFTPMFVEDKGPELNPFSAGLALVF